jgi:transforming growth factor-beta-induced protein
MLRPRKRSAAVSNAASAVIVIVILVMTGIVGVAVFSKFDSANESTVLGTLQSNGDFSTLVNALSATDLSSTLSGSTPYTLFAPTNEAFSSLPRGVLSALTGNLTMLASVLKYQIVAGKLNETEMFQMTSLVTLQGSSLPLGVSETSLLVGDNASISEEEIPCTNGVIYPIDTVLIPPIPVNSGQANAAPALMTILQTAQSLGLNYLLQGIYTAALDSILSSPGPYTLFAPSNAAMTAFSCGTPYDNCLADLANLLSNQTAITFVMQDNIASGNFTSAQLVKAGVVTTLAGQTLNITSISGTMDVGSATITQRDIRCSNGYIDITNSILVPPGVVQ